MEAKTRIEDEVMPQRNCEAKDEMNLAEFPLCALSHRLNPEVKTLRFEDRTWDKGRNEFITRQLTITGSDAYGLPTELDDEVLLGLIQLTRHRGFADRKVPFTRHELIRLLGWRNESKSYQRIEASLNRWTGVTLFYNKAWWNKERKCWMDEKFHILDNVWLCHRNEPAPDTGLPALGAPMSAFVWNEVVFRSFCQGNLKSIDFDFFKSLHSAVAKRLYRFLDKRFYHRNRCEFDLRELGCGHVGLSQKYDTANLKRKLLTGVRELEARGFLQSLPVGEQFQKVRRGEWRVVFQRNEKTEPQARSTPDSHANPLAQALIARGVGARTAERLVLKHAAEHIQTKIRALDCLLASKNMQPPRNPPGFLISSIRDYYGRPGELLGNAEPPQKQAVLSQRTRKESAVPDARDLREESLRKIKAQAVEKLLQSLSPDERQRLEAEAVSNASVVERAILERGGNFAALVRKCLLDSHTLKLARESAERSVDTQSSSACPK